MRRDGNTIDLERLRSHLKEKPRTKFGQIRQAWPFMEELFAAGHSLKDVHVWLNHIGIEIGYARLSHYTGRIRRAPRQVGPAAPTTERPSFVSANSEPLLVDVRTDPLANFLERERKRPGFQFKAEPDPNNLI